MEIQNFAWIEKPALLLFEKIANASGVIFAPWQMKRLARAQSEVAIIEQDSKFELAERERKALTRLLAEESIKQDNMDCIIQQAIPQLEESASPQDMENDWIAHFFEKCRVVSDKEMQAVWSKLLAGEANSPGSYSKRTVNALSSLDKNEAHLFTKFCGYCWEFKPLVPLLIEHESDIFKKYEIGFFDLTHLDSIGLIRFDIAGFKKTFSGPPPVHLEASYFGRKLFFTINTPPAEVFIGPALLTTTGQELARISGAEPVDGFYEYIIDRFKSKGLTIDAS